MSEFKQVEPLKYGKSVMAHMESAAIRTVHGHKYAVVNHPVCDYEQAVKLRDWLIAATATNEKHHALSRPSSENHRCQHCGNYECEHHQSRDLSPSD